MNPVRRQKLQKLLFIFLILSIVLALVLYALRQNISLFYTPTQIAQGKAPLQHTIRVGGMVEKGSIIHSTEGLKVEFTITDFDKKITVVYSGILPDLFKEGQGVVAEGQIIDNHHFKATQVLAKHDEKYMPPEVRSTLAKKVSS